MALTTQLDEEQKRLEEEARKKAIADRRNQIIEQDKAKQAEIFANTPGKLTAPEQWVADKLQSGNTETWENSPDKLTVPEKAVKNIITGETNYAPLAYGDSPMGYDDENFVAEIDPELAEMQMTDQDVPVTPEQADARQKFRDNVSVLKQATPEPAPQPEQGTVTQPTAAQPQAQPLSPYSPTSKYDTWFNQLEQEHGLPMGYLSNTARVESGGEPGAKNPKSSAKGLFQFIDSTAAALGLQDPYDVEQATQAMITLTKQHQAALTKVLGREPTGEELYLAHQQGLPKAIKMLQNPNARAVKILGRDEVLNNGGDDAMTVAEFQKLHAGRYNRIPQEHGGERVVTPADIEATGDMGETEAILNDVDPTDAKIVARRQFDENGRYFEEGLKLGGNYQFKNREVSDSGALFEGLLAGGLAVLATKLLGGDSDDLKAAFLLSGGGRFADAMNQSHRYKNRQALIDEGFDEASIEDWIIDGDRSKLRERKIDDWKEYPDGSGDLYRRLPDGRTEFRMGTPKWEKVNVTLPDGTVVQRYWNDTYKWRVGEDDKILESVVTPKATTMTGSAITFHDPNNPSRGEVQVMRKGNGYVYANNPSKAVSEADIAGMVIKEKTSASSSSKNKTVDPRSAEGQREAQLRKREAGERMRIINTIAKSPALEGLTGLEGATFGEHVYKKIGDKSKYLNNLFKQLGGKTFLENIEAMRGFGSLSNAEGDKVSRAAMNLLKTNKDGTQEFDAGLPMGAVMWELRNMVEGSLGYEFYVEELVRMGKTEDELTPEELADLETRKQEYVAARMPKPLANVPEYDWGREQGGNTNSTSQPSNKSWGVGGQSTQANPGVTDDERNALGY